MKMECPLDYSLCDRTVTVYRLQAGQVLRTVVEGCFYRWQTALRTDALGRREETVFLLVMPGDTQRVFPGDRIYPGIGPEVSAQDWPRWLPVNVPGLAEAEYVSPHFWEGRLCHVEAGRK